MTFEEYCSEYIPQILETIEKIVKNEQLEKSLKDQKQNVDKNILEQKDKLEKEYNVLKERIIDTSEMQDRRGYQKLSKRFNQLQEIMDVYKRITSLENSIIENKQFIKEEKNKELIELAQE